MEMYAVVCHIDVVGRRMRKIDTFYYDMKSE